MFKRNKRNFALGYEDIEKLKFYSTTGYRTAFVDVTSKSTKKKLLLTVAQYKQLGNLFFSVDSLKGKVFWFQADEK